MTFFKKILLNTAPALAANSGISVRRAKAAGPVAKRLMSQRDEPACTRADAAVLFPVQHVLPLHHELRP